MTIWPILISREKITKRFSSCQQGSVLNLTKWSYICKFDFWKYNLKLPADSSRILTHPVHTIITFLCAWYFYFCAISHCWTIVMCNIQKTIISTRLLTFFTSPVCLTCTESRFYITKRCCCRITLACVLTIVAVSVVDTCLETVTVKKKIISISLTISVLL